MESFAIMLIRLVDSARESLCQGIDGGDVVYIAPFDETRDIAPVVYELLAAEGLKEIHHSGVRFVGAKDVYRHRAGSMEM